jgi:hypothetical protein
MNLQRQKKVSKIIKFKSENKKENCFKKIRKKQKKVKKSEETVVSDYINPRSRSSCQKK